MKKAYFLILIILASCSRNSTLPNEKLFPHGIYYHNVKITLKDRVLNFQGVDYLNDKKHALYVLGPFNVTMASYEKEFKQRVPNIYISPEFPLSEARFSQMVYALNEMYSWDKSICHLNYCENILYGYLIKFELALDQSVQKISLIVNEVLVDIAITKYEKNN